MSEAPSRIEGGEGVVTPSDILRMQGENVIAMYVIALDESAPNAERMTASSRMTQAVHAWVNAHREYETEERIAQLEAEVYRTNNAQPFGNYTSKTRGYISA